MYSKLITLPLTLRRTFGASLAAFAALAAWAPCAIGAQDETPTPPPPQETELEKALRTHALLGRLKTEHGAECPPFLFVVERPRRDEPGRLEQVSETFAPWLQKLGEVFQREFVLYNKLEPLAKPDPLPVYLLASPAGMRNAVRYEKERGRFGERVIFLDEPGVLVTYFDANLARIPKNVLRHPLLVAAATRLIETNHRAEGAGPSETWMVRGLARYLASHGPETTPADMDDPPFDAEALKTLRPFLGDLDTRATFVVPLAELVDARTADARKSLVRQRAMDASLPLPSFEDVEELLDAQSALWLHFLFRGRGSRYRAATQRYVAKVLHGKGGAAELAATLGAATTKLDAEFLSYIDNLAGGGVVAGAAPSVRRKRESEAAIVHGEVGVPIDTDEQFLAMALARARAGQVENAVMTLEDGLELLDTGDRDRLARELERLRAVSEARDKYLTDVAERRGKLRLERDGKRLTVQVAALEDGMLRLNDNDAGLTDLPVSRITALELARNMGKKAADYGPAWISAYALLLAGEKRWDKKLEGVADDAGVRSDGTEITRLVGTGIALTRLDDLSRRPVPIDAADADEMASVIEALWKESGSLAPVRERKAALHALATEALGVVYAWQGVEESLAGKVRRLPSGKTRVTYAFDEAGEAADFLPVKDYLQGRRDERFEVPPAMQNAKLTVRGGNFEGKGAICVRHKLAFEAPTVRYEYLYARSAKGGGQATILVGICDDRKASYIGAWDIFDLEAYDLPTSFARTAFHEGERLIEPVKAKKLEIRHDGKGTVQLWVGGRKKREVEVGPRLEGSVFVWIHSTVSVAIKSFEIEGRVVFPQDDPTRDAWIATRLAEAGLGE
ncbi:MAG: hypothetical protein GY711_01530 [bacterium]|nr:hypothetical protein [bacterium]